MPNGSKRGAMSRRRLLAVGPVAIAGSGFAVLSGGGAAAHEEKLSKDKVAYQYEPNDEKMCGNCRHFRENNTCVMVEGEIAPHGWCMLWQAAEGADVD